MLPENRIPTHPGIVLKEDFLVPLNQSAAEFARYIGASEQIVSRIIRAQHSVTPELAWKFSQALGTTPEFWMNLQNSYDLAITQPKRQIARLKQAA